MSSTKKSRSKVVRKKYTVLNPFKLRGKVYNRGSKVSLSDEVARHYRTIKKI